MAKNTEDVNSTEAESLEEERKEISDLQSMLSSLFGRLDELWFATFDIEEAEATKTENVEDFTTRITDLVSKLTERANTAGVALAEKQTTIQDLETKLIAIQAELDTLKAEKAEAELNAKIAKRESALAEIGISFSENKDVILEMTDTHFDLFVSSLTQVKNSGGKSTAEVRIKLPDPVGSTEITNDVIKESHNAAVKKGK
jgi:chromosome segregation ATPase